MIPLDIVQGQLHLVDAVDRSRRVARCARAVHLHVVRVRQHQRAQEVAAHFEALRVRQ